mmetsp:Transcript_8800/g.16060  ORF Transcript_8800/g.16060 Transcript_8800/m.16060 type:complete len:222 (+) Transcript_8800:146-811(+)
MKFLQRHRPLTFPRHPRTSLLPSITPSCTLRQFIAGTHPKGLEWDFGIGFNDLSPWDELACVLKMLDHFGDLFAWDGCILGGCGVHLAQHGFIKDTYPISHSAMQCKRQRRIQERQWNLPLQQPLFHLTTTNHIITPLLLPSLHPFQLGNHNPIHQMPKLNRKSLSFLFPHDPRDHGQILGIRHGFPRRKLPPDLQHNPFPNLDCEIRVGQSQIVNFERIQ